MKYTVLALILLGCQLDGPLYVELWWELEENRGIYSDCWEAGVDRMEYTIIDRRGTDEIVEESYNWEVCEDFIRYPRFEGGEYSLIIDGYGHDFEGRRLNWSLECTDLVVDGKNTPEYECEIPLSRRYR